MQSLSNRVATLAFAWGDYGKKPQNASVRIASVPTGIRIKHLLHISLEHKQHQPAQLELLCSITCFPS
jgi:hypothetical protein